MNGGMGPSVCMDRAVVVNESPVGEACELHGASTAMVGVLKELLVLPVALATVVRATQRQWRSDKVRCGNVGLRWASSSAKVGAE